MGALDSVMRPYKLCVGVLISIVHDNATILQPAKREECDMSSHTICPCRNFISGFAHRLNQLSLAKMAVTVAQDISSPEDAVTFLQEVNPAGRTYYEPALQAQQCRCTAILPCRVQRGGGARIV